MTSFDNTGVRVAGRLTGWISRQALRQSGDRLAVELVASAVALWADAGRFPGPGVDENGHNVLLLKVMNDVRHGDERFQFLPISHELPVLAPDMLAGTVPPAGAKRPDMSLAADVTDSGWSVECKRLHTSGYSRKYVTDGMARFATGRSYSRDRALGLMVGYVYAVTADDRRDEINGHVPLLPGPSTPLNRGMPPSAGVRVHRAVSTQPRATGGPLRLEHFLIKCD